jgi:hypothetical protein
VPWAGAQLAEYSPQCPYVWILDDDDICIHPPLIAELKQITAQHDPDVIMLKMDHGPRGILPDGDYWGRTPAIAHVGCSAYVVHRAIWLVHQEAWRQGGYSADYSFIGSVFSREPRAYWHDVIASRVQQIGLGMPE